MKLLSLLYRLKVDLWFWDSFLDKIVYELNNIYQEWRNRLRKKLAQSNTTEHTKLVQNLLGLTNVATYIFCINVYQISHSGVHNLIRNGGA